MSFNPETTGRTIAELARHKGQTGQRVDAENIDLALILNLIRSGEATTRQEIERQSGLGRAIVTDRVATLMGLKLIEEGDLGPSTRGRAPRFVRFRKDAGLILLAVIDSSTIGVGCADLSGHLLAEHYEAANADDGPAPILKRLFTLFDWLLETHQGDREIWGIGLAVAAPVESVAEGPFASPRIHTMPGWEDYPLVEYLADRYGAGVRIRSSVQMMTLGELRAGSGVGLRNMIFIDIGREISAGIISEGQLHTGAQGGAGMIGHFAVSDDRQAVCRCGNTGCLQTVAGAEVIVAAARRGAQEGRSRLLAETLATSDEITPADIGVAAQRGDAFSAELLARCGRQIGGALAALTNAFNPSLIVISGSLAQTSDILLSAIREAVYRHSHPLVTRDLRLVRSQMGASSALTGAAMVIVDNFFATAPLSFWVAHGSPLRHPGMVSQIAGARQTILTQGPRPRPPDTATTPPAHPKP